MNQASEDRRTGSPVFLLLLAGAALWFVTSTNNEPEQPAPAPEITVNVEAPTVEGDTINVAPPAVEIAPADVTVNVAPADSPRQPARRLTIIEQASALAWECVPAMVTGPGYCIWKLITAAGGR